MGNGVVDDIRTVLALGAGVADQLSLPLLHHRLITRHRRPSRDIARAHLLQKAFDAREQLSSILAVVGNGVEMQKVLQLRIVLSYLDVSTARAGLKERALPASDGRHGEENQAR